MTDTRSETRSGGSTSGGTSGGSTGRSSSAASAYESARTRTTEAFSGLRDRGADLGRKTGERIESSPMIAVAGGFAVGAVLAAVLPNTRQESRMFGDVGRRINDAARGAAQNAADAGREKVEEITQAAKAKVGEAVIDAVSATTGASTTSA